jgi:hypothetical protein
MSKKNPTLVPLSDKHKGWGECGRWLDVVAEVWRLTGNG